MRGVHVRATVNLPGLSAGQETMADADSEYVQRMLTAKYLQVIYTRTPLQHGDFNDDFELEVVELEDETEAPEQADESSNLGEPSVPTDTSPPNDE